MSIETFINFGPLLLQYDFVRQFIHTPQLSAGKLRSTTTLNYILAHNLQTEFKEEFYNRLRYVRPTRAAPIKIHQIKTNFNTNS